MGKIIVHFDGCSEVSALDYASSVIDGGLISEGPHGQQYCFATKFKSGATVFADKTKSGTHVFRVFAD